MRKKYLLTLVLFILSSFAFHSSANSLPITVTSSVSTTQKATEPMEILAKMRMSEAQKLLGRKFTLKEKIAFKIAQLKIKKGLKANAEGKSSKGQTAFILSLIGIC